jgi:hypothetical protein
MEEDEPEVDYIQLMDQAVGDLEDSFLGQYGLLEKDGPVDGRIFLRSRPNLFINQGELYREQKHYIAGPAGRMRAAIDKLLGDVDTEGAKEAGK